jgi:hypothetical protein
MWRAGNSPVNSGQAGPEAWGRRPRDRAEDRAAATGRAGAGRGDEG